MPSLTSSSPWSSSPSQWARACCCARAARRSSPRGPASTTHRGSATTPRSRATPRAARSRTWSPPGEPGGAPTALLERPEPSAGRLTRLRARLARSQTALGRGLLALLSRDTLDEATWDEIEEILLGADLGVGAEPGAGRPPADAHGGRGRTDSGDHAQPAPRGAAHLGRPDARPHPADLAAPGRLARHRARRRRQRHRQDHDRRQARPGAGGRRRHRRAGCGRHVPRRGRRPAADLGRPGRAPRSCAAPRARDPASVAFDAVRAGTRAGRRRRRHRHRRPPAHQDRADGRAGQGQAGHREAGPGRRGAAGARRHHRAERPDPGAGVRRGRRRHRDRADQAGRHRQGRHRRRACSANSACRSSSSASARAPTTWRRSSPRRSSTRCSAD